MRYFVFCLSVIIIARVSSDSIIPNYPWTGDAEARNDEILNSIKKNLYLEVYRETVPKELLSSTQFLQITNVDKKVQTVYLKPESSGIVLDPSHMVKNINEIDEIRRKCSVIFYTKIPGMFSKRQY